MPRTTDFAVVRAALETDRVWAAYALGDLVPERAGHCEWFVNHAAGPAVVLLYRRFETPVWFALGPAAAVAPLLDEWGDVPSAYLHVRPAHRDLLAGRYRVTNEQPMLRMVLPPAVELPAPAGVERLGPDDLAELTALYADGEAAGERPDFFTPDMLADGTYFGVREDGRLAAAAGTHLVAEALGVGAIGNVYTRRDRRGRGLAARLTAAVAAGLRRRGADTVVLNVNRHNEPARRAYRRVGFVEHCEFREGLARLAV